MLVVLSVYQLLVGIRTATRPGGWPPQPATAAERTAASSMTTQSTVQSVPRMPLRNRLTRHSQQTRHFRPPHALSLHRYFRFGAS